jgi:hypothetical protein
MLLKQLQEAADLAKQNIRQLADMVKKAIEQDHDSDFKAETNFKQDNSNFDGRDTVTFTVDYVNSREKDAENKGQNTSKKLNDLVGPLMKQFKEAGILFTQPEGVKGSYREDDRLGTGKLEFTIGTSDQ